MIADNFPKPADSDGTQSKSEVSKKTSKVWKISSWILLPIAMIPIAGVVLILCVMFSMDHLDRTDTPLTPAEANGKTAFTFPASAKNIYFLTFAGGLQDFDLFVRFDVDRAELDSTVDSLYQQMNAIMSQRWNPPKQPISAANVGAPREEFLPMDWWNPSSVTHGYYRGKNDPHYLRILVDEDASRIYVRQND